jgi:hypothetical protein
MSSPHSVLRLLPWIVVAATAGVQGLVAQSKLVFVLPQALDQSPQLSFSSRDLDVVVDGAPLADNNNFGPISSGLLRPLNTAIATQLATLPIASPASGVIFQEDPATGAMLPSSDSLGPILTERAETLGKGRFFFGFTRQQFRFNKLEGEELGNFTAVDPGGVETKILQGGARQSTSPTTVGTQLDLRIDQNIAFFTVGVTDRLDVSAALTWVNARVGAVGFNAQIHNTGNPFAGGTCWCAQTFDLDASRNTFDTDFGRSGFSRSFLGQSSGQSTGIGDTLIRVKGTVLERPSAAVALGVDVRLPTGDELDYHGSGAAGAKPFVALSLHSASMGGIRVSPHFNAGFQFNGKSALAGDVFTGTKESLPNAFSWSVGTTVNASRRVTFVADVLGTTLIDSARLVTTTLDARGDTASNVGITAATGLALAADKQTFSMTNGAFGVKIRVAGNLILQYNVLVAFDDNSLRDKVVPLAGLGYTF